MAKKINLIYEDTEYVLEFTRSTAKDMERKGFNVNKVLDFPQTMIPMLFEGAFLKNHKFAIARDKKLAEKILDQVPGETKSELIEALIDMYNDTLEQLVTGNEKGNVTWAVTD